MKKFLLSIVAVLMAANSFAQYSSGGFSLSESSVYYGVRIGLNLSTITGDGMDDYGTKAGLNIGPVIGLRVSDSTPVFLESGLFFQMNGAKDGDNTIGLNYLKLPVLIKYGVQVTDEIAVLPFLGPTFGIGIAGDWKLAGQGSVTSFKSDRFARPDVGIRLGCGAEWNKLYLELAYEFGITNTADWKKNLTDDAVTHNGALMINFGVNF
jgi:hypothetical protein